MKQRLGFLLCSFVVFSGMAAAQGKAVTNADLEKYKQKRIQAERELKEYYAKLGLTEEDIAKRDAADAKAREELSARLRANRLEQERFEQEVRAREAQTPQVNVFVPQTDNGYSGYFVYGNHYYRYPRVWNRQYNNGVTYRVTPVGIVYEPGSKPASIWSPLVRQRQQPAWINPRTPRP